MTVKSIFDQMMDAVKQAAAGHLWSPMAIVLIDFVKAQGDAWLEQHNLGSALVQK